MLGLRRRGSLVKFLQIGKGLTCFVRNWRRVTLFLARKKLLCVQDVASILLLTKQSTKKSGHFKSHL